MEDLKDISEAFNVPFSYLSGFTENEKVGWVSDVIIEPLERFERAFPDIQNIDANSRFDVGCFLEKLSEYLDGKGSKKDLEKYMELLQEIMYYYSEGVSFSDMVTHIDFLIENVTGGRSN